MQNLILHPSKPAEVVGKRCEMQPLCIVGAAGAYKRRIPSVIPSVILASTLKMPSQHALATDEDVRAQHQCTAIAVAGIIIGLNRLEDHKRTKRPAKRPGENLQF